MAIWVGMLNGLGLTIDWQSHAILPGKAPPITEQPEVTTYQPQPTLQEFRQVWSVPLFNSERHPDAANAEQMIETPTPALDNVLLTGVVIAQELKIALLMENNEAFAVREGQALPNGWLVERISERHIELVHGQARQNLVIATPKLPMDLP